MKGKLFEKVYGCIMGAAVGDAMGAPVENMNYRDIREQFGKVEGFQEYAPRRIGGRPAYETYSIFWQEAGMRPVEEPHPFGAWRLKAGVYTDDMRWRLLGIQSFLKRRRRVTGWEFAQDVMEYRIASQKLPVGDPRHRWAKGMIILEEVVQMCLKSPFGGTILVGGIWGAPGGIINAGDLQAAAEDGGLIGAIVADALRPQATVDSIIKTAFEYSRYLPDGDYDPLPTWASAFNTRLERALKCADQSSDVFELIGKLYEWICATCPPFSVQNVFEAFPAALAMLYKAKGEFRQSVVGSVNFGRDCDTIAGIAGEIAGALNGISSIPADWVELVRRENPEPDLEQTAVQVTEALLEGAREKRRVAEDLLSMG
jgi:hypothetical protein